MFHLNFEREPLNDAPDMLHGETGAWHAGELRVHTVRLAERPFHYEQSHAINSERSQEAYSPVERQPSRERAEVRCHNAFSVAPESQHG